MTKLTWKAVFTRGLSFVILFLLASHADALTLSQWGKARCVIVRQPGATAAEQNAAQELADTLHQVTGADFKIIETNQAPRNAIIVGPGPAAESAFPDAPFGQLGPEEIVIRTRGSRLLLAGGRPRGTLYAVSQFLQQHCGVRWWTPWAEQMPHRPTLRVSPHDTRYAPVFEARDPFWFPAFNARWAARNFSNSQSANIPEEWGGCIRYKGFVHTFYQLVPPDNYFSQHPEWFSLIRDKRTHEHAQLCLWNPELRDFVVGRVKEWLRESPEARIVSVSQNDWHGCCECDHCKALDDAEGSHAGSLLDFVNYVAAGIESEFPQVAVDTLAYQYTRHPPRTVRPRPNVIVRLCSIECNFREPLDSKANAKFSDDLRGWAEICRRLYVWDYTTDFAHYLQPHPNWFELGPNLRFFADNHVRGVFEQGAYQSFGGEFAELRGWVLAQLLWNPRQDDRALIQEFLNGYYGPAAPAISQYVALMHTASTNSNLTCFSPPTAPFLNFKTLNGAESLWAKAENAVAGQPDYLPRVKLARLWTRYAWLSQWDRLRKECAAEEATWPLPEARAEAARAWLAVAEGQPGLPWTKITRVNESGLTPAKFIAPMLR